jgi:hypothetical protein
VSRMTPPGRRWRFALAVVLSGLLLAAACGDDGDSGGDTAAGGDTGGDSTEVPASATSRT